MINWLGQQNLVTKSQELYATSNAHQQARAKSCSATWPAHPYLTDEAPAQQGSLATEGVPSCDGSLRGGLHTDDPMRVVLAFTEEVRQVCRLPQDSGIRDPPILGGLAGPRPSLGYSGFTEPVASQAESQRLCYSF
jgi:hypothetical protein